MPRASAPYVVSGLLAGSALGLTLVLLIDTEPLTPGAALLIAVGVWLYTVVAIAGILLVRAPWARWLGLGTAIAVAVAIAVAGFDSAAAILTAAVSLAAVAGLAGPWLTVWLRRQPGMGPEPGAAALPLVAIGAPLVAGIAAWNGPTISVAIAAVLGVVGASAYARADRWGLWLLRLVYPIAAVVAGVQLGLAWGALLVAHGVAVTLLAWSRQASRAQRSIGAVLPAPRYWKRTP